MRHFNYYPNGGPFPGVCAMCGINRDLWDLGFEHFRGGSAMACTVCVGEVAENFGWGPKAPLEEIIVSRETLIAELEAKLATVPNLTEGFINGIRSSLADFVFAVSVLGDDTRREIVSPTDSGLRAIDENGEPAEFHPEARIQSSGGEGSNDFPAVTNRNRPGRPRKIN